MKPLIPLLLTAMLLVLSRCDADRDPVTADSLALKPTQLDWVGGNLRQRMRQPVRLPGALE